MITIQRVRVRWTKAGRGAPHADARRGLSRPVMLPAAPSPGDVLVQDVLADEATGYERREAVLSGGLERAGDAGLWLTTDGSVLTVGRLPGRATYPFSSRSARLFRLLPGQTGRWRANFRFVVGCSCDRSWSFEDWVVHVSHGPVDSGGFRHGSPDHDVDNRVHLYGGARRPGRSRSRSDDRIVLMP